jgi:hypothetical protein
MQESIDSEEQGESTVDKNVVSSKDACGLKIIITVVSSDGSDQQVTEVTEVTKIDENRLNVFMATIRPTSLTVACQNY